MNACHICENDRVLVITGKDKGKIAKVKRVLHKQGKLIVTGVNVYKRHTRPNPYTKNPGGILEKEMPISSSNVMCVCTACGQATRIGHKFVEADGKKAKVRFCKKCNEVIEKGKK